MQEVLQQKLKEYISEIEEQISVESSKIWLAGTDFELQMIKICIAHLRTNSETGTNLIKAVLFGIASSISQLKPSEELLDALMEAGKYLLLNFYDKQIKNPLKIYELYYFFENLKWSIIFQLKEGYSVKQTINQLTDGYNKYIGASQNWLIHFCWINLISGLMSYRPIIYRAEVEQMLNQKHHISWNQLIVSNQIVLMPYDKTKGKVKYSGRGTFIIREFQNLKLFQEYLLDEQVNSIKLFSQYLNFDFSSQQKSQINLQDLTINLFTNIDDLEILSSLQIALLNCYTKIKENLNLIDNQTSKDEVISIQNKTEIKIYKQDIQYLINQQKDSFLQLLYIFYEIDIIRIKETEIINNIEQILRSNEKNLGLLKDKTYIEQMPNLNEIRVEAENRFVKQLQQLPNLIVQFTQILISYEEIILDENNVKYVQKTQLKQTLIKYQQELEICIQVINNFLINFICNIKKIKNNIKQINSQISLTIPQELVSQKDISQQLILFYNSALIKNLSNQILQVYSTDWVEKNWEFNNLNEFGKNIKRCSVIALIFKFYKKLLRIQQQKINVLQYEDNIAKQCFNNKNQHTNFLENESIATDQIKSLVLERKVMIQEYFDKYPNLILNKQEINEINIIEDKIREDIISLQQKQWNQELKLQSIMILQEALNKLSQLGLNKVNKSTLKEEINLNFTNSLSNLNKKMYGDDQKAEQTELLPKNTINDLDSQIFFNFESSITQIIAVIINTKRLRRIIQQNYILFNWSSEIWGSEKKDEFQQSIKNLITELLHIIQDSCFSIQKEQQIVLNQDNIQHLSNQKCIDKMKINLILLNSHSIYKIQSQNGNTEIKYCLIYQELVKSLKDFTTLDTQKTNILSEIFGNSSHKVREALAFNVIKIDALIQETKIKEFCQNLLQKLWIYEKHGDVRNILKNKEMIEMQKQLFSNDLTTMTNQIKGEMKNLLNRIEQLENSVLTDNSIQSKEQLQQALDDFEIYFDNITDMSQKLDISMIFLKELSKDIKHIKSSIDQIMQNVSDIANDVRRLRGKNFVELLLIRKEQILKQKDENELDQIHIEIQTQEYDPVSGNKKQSQNQDKTSYLLKRIYNDFEGEVNEFLWDENEKIKDVMLLKGKAGSGKSRAAKNIEELLWSCDQIEPKWIPIYVSLPSIKDPRHNLIDQALESQNYNFDSIQIRDFKEAVKQKNLSIVLILESYDEMKQDCLEQNLYNSNRFVQEFNLTESGQNFKIIITSRQEILNSIDYQTWFYGKSISTLKEVELLPFNSDQSNEYLTQYSKVSVKRAIKRFYEFLKQLKAQSFSFNEFKIIWSQIEETVKKILLQNQNEQLLFQPKDTEKIILKMLQIQFFQLFKADQMISLNKDLLQLWGYQKFTQTIKKVKIQNLLNTPFMLEIIVYVLPKMSSFFSQATFMRQVLKQNYLKLKQEAIKSNQLLKKYSQINQNQNEQDQKILTDDIQLLKLCEYILNELDNQNFFEQNSIAHQFTYKDNDIMNELKVSFTVEFDANFVVAAFQLHQFTAFDFYKQFVDFYHASQIQKWKELGKNINWQSFLIDLQYFCTYLAIEMTLSELTQVNYKQKGKLKLLSEKDDQQDISWEDHYFNENEQDSEYKNLLRKCMLINSKGSLFSFNHKSIQEFFVADYLFNLFERIFTTDKKMNEALLLKSLFTKRNKFNLSLEHFQGCLELLKPKIYQFVNFKEKLIEIVKLQNNYPDISSELIRSSSNSIFLLSYLGEYLGEEDLNGIQLSDTKLCGISFFKSNLSNTKFDNVSIDSCNFTLGKIENANWKNLICKEIPSLIGHKQQIKSIIFLDDGATLLSGGEDGKIILWDVDQNKKPLERQIQNQQILNVSFCKMNNTLICLFTNSIFILNAKDLSDTIYQPLKNYMYEDICRSSNNQYLAVQYLKLNFFILEMQNLIISDKPQSLSYPTSNQIKCMAISFDQKLLATGGQELLLWDYISVTNIKQITSLPTTLKNVSSIFISQNSSVLILGNGDGIIEFWKILDLQNLQLLQSINLDEGIDKIEITKNNKLLLIKTKTRLFRYDCLGLINEYDQVIQIEQYDTAALIQQQYYYQVDLDTCIKEIEISPNDKILACVEEKDNKYKLSIWNIIKKGCITYIASLIDNQDQILQLKFSFDSQILICCILNFIYVWDINELKLIRKLETQIDQIKYLAISKDLTFLAIQNSHYVELFEEFCNPNSSCVSKTIGIDKNFEYKGILFLNNKLVINTENFNSSFLQFWNAKLLIQEFEQLFKVKFNYFNFCFDQNLMITIGKFGTVWEKSEVYYEEKRSLNSFNKLRWKKIEYSEKKDYLIIFDGESVYLFKDYFDSDEKSHDIQQKKIYSSPLIQAVSFSKNGKLLAFGLKNGIKIMFLDQYLKLNQDSQYINDFSISDDSSLLVLATNRGIRLKNQETNKEIFYTLDQKYLLIRFIEQSQKFVAIAQSFLYLYKLDDINNPIVFQHLILCGNKIQAIYNLEQSNSMMILYDKFITIHELKEKGNNQLLEIQNEFSISKDCLILSKSNYVGIGIDNDIRFIPLSNSIKMHNIYNAFVSQFYNILYYSFSLNCQEFIIIGLNYEEKLQRAKINLINLEIEIKSSEINFGFNINIYSNQKQDKLLLVHKDNQNYQRKLDLIDFESLKIIQCIEQLNHNESSCNYAIFSEDNSYFITKYKDQTIKLWDSKTYKLLSKFKSDTTNFDLISISTKEILAQSNNHIIKLWNLKALRSQQSEMDGHSDSINLISISPDGLQLVSGSLTQIIRWELTKFKKIDVLIKGQGLRSIFCFSEDANYFAAVDKDPCLIIIWKLNTLYLIENFMTISYFTQAINLKFKIADNHLISCYQIESQLYHIAWDLSKPELYQIQRKTCYVDIPKPVMQFLSDNNLMIQIKPLKIFVFFDQESSEYFQFDNSQSISDAKLVTITHDNLKMAVQNESEIIIWSFKKQQIEHRFENDIGCTQNLVFSGDNNILFTNYNVTIRCLDVTNQYKIIKEFKLNKPDEMDEQQFDQAQCFPVENDNFLIIYSFIEPLKKIVILATYVSDFEQFQMLLETKTSRDFFNCAYCDKRQILAIQNNFYFSLFDMKSKKQIAILEPNQFTNFNPHLLSFQKDGNLLVSIGYDMSIILWDLSDLRKIKLKVNQNYQPNQQEVISISFQEYENQVYIQKILSSNDINADNISDYVEYCQFLIEDINYNYLIEETSEYKLHIKENKIEIKKQKDGKLIYCLDQFNTQINCATFTPCGQKIILGMENGSILFYRLDQNQNQPKCFKSFTLYPLILADSCSIKGSIFFNQENRNLQNLFHEKGSITQ